MDLLGGTVTSVPHNSVLNPLLEFRLGPWVPRRYPLCSWPVTRVNLVRLYP